jgi:hypothetical protein
MDKKDLVWIILISVILLVLVSLTIPILVQTPHPGPGQNPLQQQPGPGQIQQPQSQGQDESRHIKTAISFINIGLIVPLFVIYTGIYRRMQSSFTLGLMVVIFALGMYAVTSCPLLVSLLGGHAGDIGFFQIIPDLCTTVALIILIRISLE